MASSNSDLANNQTEVLQSGLNNGDIERFSDVANSLADASGKVIRSFFRKNFEILDKDDLSEFFFCYSAIYTSNLMHFTLSSDLIRNF